MFVQTLLIWGVGREFPIKIASRRFHAPRCAARTYELTAPQLLYLNKLFFVIRSDCGKLRKTTVKLRMSIPPLWLTLGVCSLVIGQSIIKAPPEFVEVSETLDCHKRMYTYHVTQTDENGRSCRDKVSVMACWGRCDSNEIADWRFPYKKSNHPVCVHYGRKRSEVILRNCDEGVMPLTRIYQYLEADECKCQQCSSSDTSCEGITYRPHRSHPDSLGFKIN
ncbi:thyrostimulin beta-5 subunit [Aethina tumida]|uniref:thyrostimulin beta-5 subunit n=1 Tax=Aethina tumida TaxID=116153 RepID=UPI0021475A18|nr:thyrostimulin beta-5 subunit [Aethina tumida]